MGDFGTLARQRDALVYGEANHFDANGVTRAAHAWMSRGREACSGPMRAARGPEQVASTEGEPPRWWPGLRHQGASLNGWLRIVSAPLRYYTLHDAC